MISVICEGERACEAHAERITHVFERFSGSPPENKPCQEGGVSLLLCYQLQGKTIARVQVLYP